MLSVKRMMGFSGQVVVNVPPEKVFSYVTNFHRHHEWLWEEAETEKTSQGPVGVGSTFKRRDRLVPWSHQGVVPADFVVTEYAPNKQLAFERRAPGGFRFSFSIDLEPEPVSGGTRVTVRRELVHCPWWEWPLMVPFLPVLPVYYHFVRRKIRRMGSPLKEYYQRSAL